MRNRKMHIIAGLICHCVEWGQAEKEGGWWFLAGADWLLLHD